MKWKARDGKATLHYRKIDGKVMFVTFFDASLGKKAEQLAQSGEIHFVTSEKAQEISSIGNIVEYHSNKISRVVKSSMAAEGVAMSIATDYQLFARLLWDAFCYGKTMVSSN